MHVHLFCCHTLFPDHCCLQRNSSAHKFTFTCGLEAAVKELTLPRLPLSILVFASLQANFTMADRTDYPGRSARRLARLRCKHSACLIREVDSCVGEVCNDRARAQEGGYSDRGRRTAHRFVVSGLGVCVCRSDRLGGILRSKYS